jgi:hypothetical protein
MVVFSVAFAAWGWLRPYEWSPDPKAKAEIVGVELRRDHSYYWLTVHARAKAGEVLDITRPASLVACGGKELMPADTRLEGTPETGFREVWFKFWLDSKDLESTLALGLQDGRLTVKSSDKAPSLKQGETLHFTTHRW